MFQVYMISFASGAISTALSHPFEFLKTKIQIYNEGIGIRQRGTAFGYNMSRVYWHLHEAGYGTSVLYTGFKEALAARLGYLAIRNTIYKTLYDLKKPVKARNDLNHREKGAIAAVAGGLATAAVHPLETIMVRKIGDLGRAAKFHHTNLQANVYNGLYANILRAAILNGIIIWPYDQIKERCYITFGDIWPNRFIALAAASVVGMASTIVFDVVRTRQMYAFADKHLNRLNYNHGLDVVHKAVTHEGLFTFLAGSWPLFMKMYAYGAAVS